MSRSTSSNTGASITRTVAIIKTHALPHRFDIERRIQEASFEIVKERQMEFDTETDPETLYELFGEDADSLAEGPVWVYVLERRRAVEVWGTLMGDRDVHIARQESPNSLRALYGISRQQNGLMGSPDNHIAEIQIASLFASSPPFPTSELPAEDGGPGGRYGSVRSINSGVLESMRRAAAAAAEDEGYAHSSATNPSTHGGGHSNSNGKVPFKARNLPVTHVKPDIVPRTTKAAALRAGQLLEKRETGPRAPVSKEQQKQAFMDVPGHKRSSTIAVASTAPPTVAPRMTRAASLRLGQPAPPPPSAIKKRASMGAPVDRKETFEGVPGHKRRESIAVASVKAPTVAPRLNKTAALRATKDQGPPTSFQFRKPVGTPTLSRASSSSSLSPPRTAQPPRPASQASAARPSIGGARSSSVLGTRSSVQKSAAEANGNGTSSPAVNGSNIPGRPPSALSKPVPKPTSIGNPTIAPRTNKSAALRAAKQEAELAAAAAAEAKKARRASRVPPSSFKTVPV